MTIYMLNPHFFLCLTTSKLTKYASVCSYIIFIFFTVSENSQPLMICCWKY